MTDQTTTPTVSERDAQANTDRELYREPDRTGHGNAYCDSIHVTEDGGVGINCGGHVIVLPLREWHNRAKLAMGNPLPDAQGWRPIESAPKDGARIALWDFRTGYVPWVYWDKAQEIWVSEVMRWGGRPTHWMPLPAPPLQEVK